MDEMEEFLCLGPSNRINCSPLSHKVIVTISDIDCMTTSTSLSEQDEPLSVCRAVMARNGTHKLVLRGDPQDEDHHSELYDLTRDPRETRNLGTYSIAKKNF